MSSPPTRTEQPSSLTPSINALGPLLFTPRGLMLLGILFLSILASSRQHHGGKKLATARFGGYWEKRSARLKAISQISHCLPNEIALYIGEPQSVDDIRPLYVPDAQRGIAVMGGPGSGKTYSVIDPLVRSALEQGFPVILYDYKYPQQTARHAAYASHLGYDIRVL